MPKHIKTKRLRKSHKKSIRRRTMKGGALSAMIVTSTKTGRPTHRMNSYPKISNSKKITYPQDKVMIHINRLAQALGQIKNTDDVKKAQGYIDIFEKSESHDWSKDKYKQAYMSIKNIFNKYIGQMTTNYKEDTVNDISALDKLMNIENNQNMQVKYEQVNI